MLNPQALQLRVDVGSQCHSVAVGLTDGSLLEEFELKKFGRLQGKRIFDLLTGLGLSSWDVEMYRAA